MAKSHEHFMGMALEEARKAMAEGDEPFGSVVVRDDEVIVRARNRINTTLDVTAHAESVALREATRTLGKLDLTGCTLYATWEPCPMCCGTIIQARISTLVLGGRRSNSHRGGYSVERLLELTGHESQLRVVTGVLQDRCEALVLEWKRRR